MAAQSSKPAPRRWMIYGANGYTGELIAREAARRGLKPVLAGRPQAAGVTLCPGVGFDSRSSFSPGIAKTSVDGLAQGGKVRRTGKTGFAMPGLNDLEETGRDVAVYLNTVEGLPAIPKAYALLVAP